MLINIFDLFVTLLIIGFGISGFREGLVKGAVKLFGFIITVVAMALFSEEIIRLSGGFGFLSPKIAVPAAFIVFFVAGMLGFNILAHILRKMIHLTPIGFVDSGLGTAFGIIKALLLSGMIALALSFAPQGSFFRGQYETSRSGVPLVSFLTAAVPFVKSAALSLHDYVLPRRQKPLKEKNEDKVPDDII